MTFDKLKEAIEVQNEVKKHCYVGSEVIAIYSDCIMLTFDAYEELFSSIDEKNKYVVLVDGIEHHRTFFGGSKIVAVRRDVNAAGAN